MIRRPQMVLGTVLCAVVAAGLAAQQPQERSQQRTERQQQDQNASSTDQTQLYFIHQEHVKPAMAREYEEAMGRLVDELEAYDIQDLSFQAVHGPHIGYAYLMKVNDFTGMDQARRNWRAAVEKIGEQRWEELAGRTDAAVEHRASFFATLDPALSYEPQNPSLAPDEVGFIAYKVFYPISGKEKELEELGKQFVELYRENDIGTSWQTFRCVTGKELPAYIVAIPARDVADYHHMQQSENEKLGQAARDLYERIAQVSRRYELKEGWPRPELSYNVEGQAESNQPQRQPNRSMTPRREPNSR